MRTLRTFGWRYVNKLRQVRTINPSEPTMSVINAFFAGLFTATSIGLIPFRVLDTWRMSIILTSSHCILRMFQEYLEYGIIGRPLSSVEGKWACRTYMILMICPILSMMPTTCMSLQSKNKLTSTIVRLTHTLSISTC